MNTRSSLAHVDFTRQTFCLLGLPFDALTMPAIIDKLKQAIAQRQPCFLSTPNLNFLVNCLDDTAFRNSVLVSDLSIADGMPIVWLARILGLPITERTSGSDLFDCLRQSPGHHIRLFFLGGMDGVAESACRVLNADSSSAINAVGYLSPGFGSIQDMSSDEMINTINATQADFLLIALGAKKGQAWVMHNRHKLNVPVMSHLGAVINFVAGHVKRAPKYIQRLGLEWLWRIYQEPALWQRYYHDGLRFLKLLLLNIVPYWFWQQTHRTLLAQTELAKVDIIEQSGAAVLVLSGTCTHATIEPIRQALTRIATSYSTIRFDLAKVSVMDSSFIGLCLLAYSHCFKQAGELVFLNVSSEQRRIFTWHCAEFLLTHKDF
ncbi:WecB/TagA/CpsF family glycosyltransferase [Methylocucumis oryzae]|nr:WecB/TagA/CpsF family glycosyltransferase [Methylocucumis oryzae]